MNRVLKIVTTAMLAALFTTGAAVDVFASGKHKSHAYGYGRDRGHAEGHQRHRGHNRHARVAPLIHLFGGLHQLSRGFHQRPRIAYGYRPRHGANRGYSRPCHAVTKIGYDGYGRRAKFGGTMCYNHYGRPYIVVGSRHIIHYY